MRIHGVLLMQPKNWGISLGRMDLKLSREGNGAWKIVSKDSRLIPVTADTAPDPQILEIARPYHELAERYLNTPVANAPEAMDTKFSRVEDTPAIDAIQQVQLDATHADVSFASSVQPERAHRQGAGDRASAGRAVPLRQRAVHDCQATDAWCAKRWRTPRAGSSRATPIARARR